MAAQTFTLEDLRIALTTALEGAGIAAVGVGQTTMDEALNKAVARVLSESADPAGAAALYTVAPLSPEDGQADHPQDLFVPIAIEVPGKKTARRGLADLLQMSLAFIPGVDEYGYSFAGAKTLIRPQVDSANLHYIAVPPELTAPEDAFPLSPVLFSAVVEIATQTCLRKMGIASAQQGSPPAG